MPYACRSASLRLYNKKVAFHGLLGGSPSTLASSHSHHLSAKKKVHHKVTLMLCSSNVQHHGTQRPLPPQIIYKLIIHN